METVVSKCIHDEFKAKHYIDTRKCCLYAIWKLKKIKSSKTLNITICSVNHNDICNKKTLVDKDFIDKYYRVQSVRTQWRKRP